MFQLISLSLQCMEENNICLWVGEEELVDDMGRRERCSLLLNIGWPTN